MERDFQLDSTLDTAKSAVTTADNGDVYIEGWASTVGADRAGDLIEPGAFDESIARFMASNPVLLHNHDLQKALGEVLNLESKPEGLWMKARIDAPAAGSWAEDVVRKITRGTIKGLSVRGKMFRPNGSLAQSRFDGGGRVNRVDLYEISTTPLPVEPGSLFAVTAKAFEVPAEEISQEEADSISAYFNEQFSALEFAYQQLSDGVDRITSAHAERLRTHRPS